MSSATRIFNRQGIDRGKRRRTFERERAGQIANARWRAEQLAKIQPIEPTNSALSGARRKAS